MRKQTPVRYGNSQSQQPKLTKKFLLEQGDDDDDECHPLHQSNQRSSSSSFDENLKPPKESLTHGFFGELTQEICSKHLRDYSKGIVNGFCQSVLYEIQNLMSIMQTNKGRDKIFSLIQYIIMLYVKCMQSPNQSMSLHRVFDDQHLQTLIARYGRMPDICISHTVAAQQMSATSLPGSKDFLNNYFQRLVRKDHEDFTKTPRVATCKKIVKQIRSARKMFKLLKFIDQFKNFQKGYSQFSLIKLDQATRSLLRRQMQPQHISVFENLFQLIGKISSTLYYLLDNWNLVMATFLGNSHRHKELIKRWKDWFNLSRNWFQHFRSILKVRRSHQTLKIMEKELEAYHHKVVGTTCLKATELVRIYINRKQKMYDHIFVLFRNSFRIMMLNYKLKLPVHRDIFNPIVITEIGVVMSITAIFKIWMKERNKNIHGQYVKMQDFIKTMPRVEQLAQQQANATGQDKAQGSAYASSSCEERGQLSQTVGRRNKNSQRNFLRTMYSTPDDSSDMSIAFKTLQSQTLKKGGNQHQQRQDGGGRLVPNRNSFYKGQFAMLQAGRKIEFQNVSSQLTLLASKVSQQYDEEIPEDDSPTTEMAESLEEELNLDLIDSAEEQNESSSFPNSEVSLSPSESIRFAHLDKNNSSQQSKKLTVRFEYPILMRNRTSIGLKPSSILRKHQSRPRTGSKSARNVTKSLGIGDQMTKLFKDDHVYETGLIDNPNFKLLSLRDFSAIDMTKMGGSSQGDDNDERVATEEEAGPDKAKIKYLSDESLYD